MESPKKHSVDDGTNAVKKNCSLKNLSLKVIGNKTN